MKGLGLALSFMAAACSLDWTVPNHPADASNETQAAVCTPSRPCPSGQLCTYGDHACGGAGAGVCGAPATGCSATAPSVCGCNGTVYANVCQAGAAAVDTAKAACAVATEHFQCEYIVCIKSSYCEQSGGTPAPTLSCIPFDASCTAHDCTCVSGLCMNSCTPLPAGGVEVTCP